jgi:uncharacterized protein
MNTVGYFEIQSTNLQREIEFYTSVFGWTFIKEKLTPIEYYRIETNSIYGGLLGRPAPVSPEGSGTNAFVCSMQVESFDNTANIITQHGGKIAMPKFAVPGRCWQGYFLDADYNTFGVFEVDANAR